MVKSLQTVMDDLGDLPKGFPKSSKKEELALKKFLETLNIIQTNRHYPDHWEGWVLDNDDCCDACMKPKKKLISWSPFDVTTLCVKAGCKCADKASRYSQAVRNSMMTPEAKKCTFANIDKASINREALQAAEFYANNFDQFEKDGVGVFFVGENGTAKSHLCYAILNRVIENFYKTCILLSTPEMLKDLKQNEFDTAPYLDCDVLCLDDVGRERSTEYGVEELFNIINHRVRHNKVIIGNSNFAYDYLVEHYGDDAIPSRIIDRCKIIEATAADYRLKHPKSNRVWQRVRKATA